MVPADRSSGIRAELFGGLSVVSEGRTALKFRTRKTAALFAYLAYYGGKVHQREVLVDMFWPEANLDAGRQSLRMALSAIRSTLDEASNEGAVYLESDRSTVSLRNVRTDVEEFDSLSQENDVSKLTRAIRVVKGPLLAGHDDNWIIAQWLRIEEAYSQVAVRLMDLSTTHEERQQALIAGREAVALLGAREDVHMALMRLYVREGMPSLAVAQFEELERQMDEQWGEAPSQAAVDLLESVPQPSRPSPEVPRSRIPNVPTRASTFFGRDAEIAQLATLLQRGGNRLLTLTGPGGCGKTSLALVVGRELESRLGLRTHVCELASLTSPDRIVEKILAAVTGKPDLTPTVQKLAEELSDEPCVLILDNFEHLLPPGAAVAKAVLESIPACRLFVTSRSVLGIDGEQVWPLTPLPVPESGLKLAALREVPSVVLFVDRASSAKPGFALKAENAVAISEICRRTEGLPLAIELAAARIVTHSPAQILAKLVNSFDFLVSRKRDVEDRHKSLRGTLEWSLSLLDDSTRSVFGCLGVFQGGFFLPAAEAVTGVDEFDESLTRLVESSLVVVEDHDFGPRFRLLEPVREYARSLLSDSQLRKARRRHYSHYFLLAKSNTVSTPEGTKEWLDRLNVDHENLLAAFEGVFDQTITPDEAIELVVACRTFFRPRGHAHVWRDELTNLKATLDDNVSVRTRAWITMEVARISSNMVDVNTMRELYAEVLELGSKAQDDQVCAQGHHGMAGTYKSMSKYAESIKEYEKAIALFRKVGDWKWVAMTMRQLAMSFVSQSDHDTSYQLLKDSVPFARKGGDPDTLAWCLTDVAVEHALHGFVDESNVCFAEAHKICESTDSPHMRSIVLWQQGETELRTGRPDDSVRTHRQSVQSALKANFKEGLKWILVSFGAALVSAGNIDLGLRTLARTVRWRVDEHRSLTGDERELLEPAKATCAEFLGSDKFSNAWQEGESSDLDELIETLVEDGPGS